MEVQTKPLDCNDDLRKEANSTSASSAALMAWLTGTRNKLSEATQGIRENSADVRDAAVGYIRHNPLVMIGAAAAVGLLLGVLLSRR